MEKSIGKQSDCEYEEININEKFYDGFEGEPEITFCLTINNIIIEKVGIWDGYFNKIMKLIEPEKEGWTGLAYYYHLYTGWYEEDNWLISNISEAYKQLVNINFRKLVKKEEKEVLILMIHLLKQAIDNDGKVYIMYN